jgi:hypothetical protein
MLEWLHPMGLHKTMQVKFVNQMDKCCVIRSKKLGRNIFSKSHNEYIVAFFNSGYVAWSYTLVHESFSILHICIYEVTQGFLIIIYCNTMEKCFGTRRDNHGTSLCVFKILIHILKTTSSLPWYPRIRLVFL